MKSNVTITTTVPNSANSKHNKSTKKGSTTAGVVHGHHTSTNTTNGGTTSVLKALPLLLPSLLSRPHTSSPTSPSPRNCITTTMNKKQLKLERQLQKEQENQSKRSMLWWILVSYIGIVTTIFIVFLLANPPQHIQNFWLQASLATLQNQNVILMNTKVQSSSSSSSSSSASHERYAKTNEEGDFVEVDGGRRPTATTTATATTKATTMQSIATSKKSSSTAVIDESQMVISTHSPLPTILPSFSFQRGEVFGVEYIQCCTMYGSGGTPSHIDMDEHGIPLSDIYMPVSSTSNDVVLLGRRFFRSQLVTRDMKHGGNIPLTDVDLEHRAFYEYCITAEQHDGYIDSIIALDLDHTASTLYITNILNELLQIHRISALPVAALVTPEQSSQTILDWIMYGDRDNLMHHVARHWIPISAGPNILQTISDDQYGSAAGRSDDDDDDDEMDAYNDGDRNEHHYHNKIDGTSPPDRIGSSISIPSSSIFREIDQWPILTISGMDDTISQTAAETLRNEHHLYTNHSIIPGNASCYLYAPSLVMVAIIDYFVDWESRHPKQKDDRRRLVDDQQYNNNNNNRQLLQLDNDDDSLADKRECSSSNTKNGPVVANIFPV